jgi:hypothetical protein
MLAPMVERELRVALLHRQAQRQWMVAARTAGGICLVFLLFLGFDGNQQTGGRLFRFLFALGCFGVVARGFGLTADLFSEERRSGTLGLLVLTGLTPMEIFTNKLLVAALLTAYGLLGGLPFFAVPFLTGGVPATQFLCALVFLANGLGFCIAMGLLASVLHRDGGQAHTTAVAVTGVLCLATPLLRWLGSHSAGGGVVSGEWLTLSPAYAPFLVFGSFPAAAVRLFWTGSEITLCYSLTALLLAAWILQRTWRDGPEALAPKKWLARWQNWMRGDERWRGRLREGLLAEHPFCWLAARDRGPVLIARVWLGLAVAVWLAGLFAWGRPWLSSMNAFAVAFVVHLGLNWILAYAISRRFAEERRIGGFEILLTAPIYSEKIVDDQCKALMVQFQSELLVVVGLDLVWCVSGLVGGGVSPLLVVPYLLCWGLFLVFWFAVHLDTASRALWISAWTGRAAYSAMQSVKHTSVLFILGFFFFRPGGAFLFQSGGFPLVLLFAVSVPAILLTFYSRYVHREKLTCELRLIASAPIPAPGDKRFQGWDPAKIFPPDDRWERLVAGRT